MRDLTTGVLIVGITFTMLAANISIISAADLVIPDNVDMDLLLEFKSNGKIHININWTGENPIPEYASSFNLPSITGGGNSYYDYSDYDYNDMNWDEFDWSEFENMNFENFNLNDMDFYGTASIAPVLMGSIIPNSILATVIETASWEIEVEASSPSSETLEISASGWVSAPVDDETNQKIAQAVSGFNLMPSMIEQQILNLAQSSTSDYATLNDIDISTLTWDTSAKRLTFTISVMITDAKLVNKIESELPITITLVGNAGIPSELLEGNATATVLGQLTVDAMFRIVATTTAAQLDMDINGDTMNIQFDIEFEPPEEMDIVEITGDTMNVDFSRIGSYWPGSFLRAGESNAGVTFTIIVPEGATVSGLPAGYTQSGTSYTWTGTAAVDAFIDIIMGRTSAQISYYIGAANVEITDITNSVGETIEPTDKPYISSVQVETNDQVTVNFERNQPLRKLRVKLLNAARANITISAKQYNKRPTGIAAVAGNRLVSHYIEATANTTDTIERATFEFRVPKVWINANNIDEETITLLRYVNGSWEELPTSSLGEEDADFKYFSAETPGFSTFAVTAQLPTVPSGTTLPPWMFIAVGITIVIVATAVIAVYLIKK